jgi:hypothetical protein
MPRRGSVTEKKTDGHQHPGSPESVINIHRPGLGRWSGAITRESTTRNERRRRIKEINRKWCSVPMRKGKTVNEHNGTRKPNPFVRTTDGVRYVVTVSFFFCTFSFRIAFGRTSLAGRFPRCEHDKRAPYTSFYHPLVTIYIYIWCTVAGLRPGGATNMFSSYVRSTTLLPPRVVVGRCSYHGRAWRNKLFLFSRREDVSYWLIIIFIVFQRNPFNDATVLDYITLRKIKSRYHDAAFTVEKILSNIL